MCVEKTPWEQVIDFHGHTCPGVAIGFRVAQLAQRELGIKPAQDSELLVAAETRSCALDAFQVLNKATLGRGTLRIEEKGKHVYYFHYTGTGAILRIGVKGPVIEHTAPPQTFASPRQKQNWALENVQYVLSTPEEDFCTLQKLEGSLEKPASSSQWGTCQSCQEAVRLTQAVETDGKILCADCSKRTI